MDVRVGGAEFDTADGVVYIGFAEFDAASASEVCVGWAELDCLSPLEVCLGWCELDCQSPSSAAVPTYSYGGGVTRYHSRADKKYDIPLDVSEDDEENIIMAILLEIAADVLH